MIHKGTAVSKCTSPWMSVGGKASALHEHRRAVGGAGEEVFGGEYSRRILAFYGYTKVACHTAPCN